MVSNDTRNNLIVLALITALCVSVGILIQNIFIASKEVGTEIREASATQTSMIMNLSQTITNYINKSEADKNAQSEQIDRLIKTLNLILSPNMTYTGLGEGQ